MAEYRIKIEEKLNGEIMYYPQRMYIVHKGLFKRKHEVWEGIGAGGKNALTQGMRFKCDNFERTSQSRMGFSDIQCAYKVIEIWKKEDAEQDGETIVKTTYKKI